MIARGAVILALLLPASAGTFAKSVPQAQVLIAPASPQSSPPQPVPSKLTLAAAMDAAETNYPRVRAALEQQNAAQATIGVARAAYLPRVDMLWQTNRATANNIYGLLLPQSIISSLTGPVIASDFGRSAWSSAGATLLSWQPVDFGARAAQVTVARQAAQAAGATLNLTRLDVAVITATAYFDLATAQRLAATAQANVNRLQVFGNSVHVLVNNQLRPGADAAQADAQLALAQTQLIQAQTSVEVRRAVLANLIGGPVGELDDAQLLVTPAEQATPTMNIVDHPAARQEAALVGQQQARLSFLNRSYVPQFTLQGSVFGRGAGTTLNGIFPGGTNGLAPDIPNWVAGIQMTFPAFDFFSLKAQKKAQTANVRAEQARYSQVIDDLSSQVQQAQAQLAGAQQVARNTPIELAAAQQSETQQRARFQSGLATVIDVAAAESLLVQAESDDAVARLNVWRALAALAAARGNLTPFLNQLGTKP
jgi:outer membrane protein TolC